VADVRRTALDEECVCHGGVAVAVRLPDEEPRVNAAIEQQADRLEMPPGSFGDIMDRACGGRLRRRPSMTLPLSSTPKARVKDCNLLTRPGIPDA
jgi:hypothetical protein